MPVADLAAPDSALFLWATFPQLPEALRLIEAWGFTYKSVAFVWLKKNKKADSWFYGLGFWTRGNAEICLLATKGHPKRQAANIHQFIISPIEAHSKKPDEARAKIISLMGDLPRVELFARQTPPGSPATSFDCSGYVSWVINHSGWNVGRLGAQGLYNICTPTSSPKPGDLVFFKGTYDTPGVSHCGIYVGDGKMLHCGDPIGYANLNTSYWQSHFYAYGRLP